MSLSPRSGVPEEFTMKRMLINATQPEELRVAIAEGQHLFDLDIEVPSQEQKKSNVYKGRITRVEPSLEACFVEFGSARHGFLPLKEICESSYTKDYRKKDGRVAIRDVVREGQEIIVQVEKEERGNKGAALTTYISLAGRYLVLMPTNPSAGGVSRRITGSDRDHLREQLQQVTAPDNVGIIIRTAGVGRDADELQWDLDYLLQLWTAIELAASNRNAPFLIYQESNLFIRALRDHLRNDIGEILVDNERVYNDAREFMQQVMPHNLNKLKLYSDQVPLFSRYQIESQIESAFARTVHLPSGGAVVFDHTEALLSIDINSARATKGSDIEETAYNTNMESAVEIARQLRLRDLGGLIVIDFIDMTSRKHQREVEECLRRALQIDKARVQIGRISRFGLLEMSRQRLRPSLGESSQETCPICEGHGTIRSVESLALSILRLIEEEVMKDYTGQIVVQAPNDVVNFLHNEKRSALADVESRHKVPIMMLANEHMVTPHFEIHRVKTSDVSESPSYKRIDQPEAQLVANERSQANVVAMPAPAVKRLVPERQAPVRTEEKAPGLFSRLANILFSSPKEEEKPKSAARKKTTGKSGSQQNRRATTQSNRQQTQKKATRKRRPAKGGQSNAQQQRTSKKRTSKKAQSKPQQNRQKQNRNRKPATKERPAEESKTAATSKPVQDSTSTASAGGAAGAAGGSDKAEQNEGGSRRGGRRRRSPYKTGGSKPRPERSETQVDTPTENQQVKAGETTQKPASTPMPEKPADSNKSKSVADSPKPVSADAASDTKTAKSEPATAKPAAKASGDTKAAETKSAEKKTAGKKTAGRRPAKTGTDAAAKKSTSDAKAKEATSPPSSKPRTPVKATESKAGAEPAPSSEKVNASTDPAKEASGKPVTKKPARKRSASKKTATRKTADSQAKSSNADKTRKNVSEAPKPSPAKGGKGPVAEPQQGTKGLYTLKPEPAPKPVPAEPDS